MGSQPSPDDIDPTGVADKAGFGELLQQFNVPQSATLRETVEATGSQFSKTSLNDWYNGQSLPDETNLRIYLRYFGVSEPRVADWQRVRNQISKSERQQRRRTEVIAANDVELSRAHAEIDALKASERRLAAQLAEKEEQRQALDDELQRKRDELKTSRATTATIKAELRGQIDEHLERLADAYEQIGELKYRLGHTRGLRERAEVERTHLIAQREALVDAAPDSDDQAMLQFQRAQHEQKLREKVELENTRLLGEIEALKKQIAEDVSKPGAELAQPERPLPVPRIDRTPATNTDVEFAVHIQRDEFDQEYGVMVPFAWYCLQCDCGGELRLTSCPHCKRAVERNFQKETFVRLPSRPRTRLIHLDGEGNYDYPGVPRGRVCVQIIVTRG